MKQKSDLLHLGGSGVRVGPELAIIDFTFVIGISS